MREQGREQCMCGSQRQYVDCCGPYLAGKAVAPTAEALMRSRYTAFCQGNIDYLIATSQLKTTDTDERLALIKTIKSTRWVNLLVVKTQKGTAKDKTGTVEFVAAYRSATSLLSLDPADRLAQLHEKSRFKRIREQWIYTGGDILPPYQPKPSQPCWCGSQTAFRHCHAQPR